MSLQWNFISYNFLDKQKLYLHVWQILEDEGLVKLWIEIFPVDLRLVLWFLIRKKVDLDKGVRQSGGPVGRRQLAALDDLQKTEIEMRKTSDNLQ